MCCAKGLHPYQADKRNVVVFRSELLNKKPKAVYARVWTYTQKTNLNGMGLYSL